MLAGFASWVISRISPKTMAILAVCVGIALVYYLGARSAGERAERRAVETTLQQARERVHVEDSVDRESDPVGRLQRDWQRD